MTHPAQTFPDESYGVHPIPLLRRPRTRGECAGVPRPCPFASCRYSLVAEVSKGGRVVELPEGEWSCALDAAEHTGGMTKQEIGDVYGITRQGVEVIEFRALRKIAARARLVMR